MGSRIRLQADALFNGRLMQVAVTIVANSHSAGALLEVKRRPIPTTGSVAEDRTLDRAVLLVGLYVAMAGATSFLGWAADVPRLTDWDNNGISIQPNASIAATAAGVALMLRAAGHNRLSMALGVLVAAIGGATIFEYVTGVDLGIDTLLMFDRPWGRRGTVVPGRMGPPGSLSWTLIGTGLILVGARSPSRRFASVLGVLVVSIAALSLTGYTFGADRLYTIPTLTVIAFQTATMALGSGLGILLAARDQQPMRLLLENSAAGLLTRRLLPLVIALPVVLGFIRVVGQNAGLYDTAMGTAMLVLVLIALLCAVLWWGAGAVREYESKLVTSIRELEGVFRAAPAGIAVSRDSRCERVEVNAAFAGIVGIREGAPALAAWAETARTKPKPTKSEQDQLDACICLVSALHLAKRRDALFVGCCTTGYIVVPYSEMLRNELEHRCWELGRESARWVRVLQWGAAASTVVPDI